MYIQGNIGQIYITTAEVYIRKHRSNLYNNSECNYMLRNTPYFSSINYFNYFPLGPSTQTNIRTTPGTNLFKSVFVSLTEKQRQSPESHQLHFHTHHDNNNIMTCNVEDPSTSI